MSRRDSEITDRMPPTTHKPSNLEKNCNQILARGPALTRGLLKKVKKNKTHIMGHEMETKQFYLISGLVFLFLLSVSGTIAMWFTDTFDNGVFSNLAIIEGSTAYEMFIKPSPKPLLKVSLFNYTNVEEFASGDAKKLNIQELGPYIYEIALERINAKFNKDKVSYQEKRVYKYMPQLSKGKKQNDKVTVPNIPLHTAVSTNKHANFLARLSLSGLLNSINVKPFITLPAHRFIVGYEDSLYSIAKSYMKLQNQNPYETFGLVSSNIGVRDDVVTINTGAKDINKIGFVDRYNGKKALDYWSTVECNKLNEATDGTLFPPKLIRNKKPVNFFLKEMCRPLPLHYQKDVKILNGKIPAYRYVLPDNVFDSPERTPSNQCYCNLDLGECPPQGVFNATPCSLGAPIFLTFPYFHNADPSLKDTVTGLNPTSDDYQSYVDIHPTLGFTMAGKNRIQVNVKVSKLFGISQVQMFNDGMILPVAIMETYLEDKTLPEDMVGIIFQTTFTLKSVELGLKYGCLMTMGVTFVCILLMARNIWLKKAGNLRNGQVV